MIIRNIKKLFVSSCIVLLVVVYSTEVKSKEVYIKDGAIVLNGDINERNVDRIIVLYENSDASYLILQSPGGDVEQGLVLANYVRDNKIPVYVPSYCNSACTFAFFSSPKKDMGADATISIHNVSSEINYDEYSAEQVKEVSKFIAESSAQIMILYIQSGIPIDIVSKAATKFKNDAIDLKRSALVRYNILPKGEVDFFASDNEQ